MDIIAIFMGVLQLLLNLTVLIFEFVKGSLSVFMWGVLLVMFGIPHFISVILGDTTYPSWVYALAAIFVVLFIVIYLGIRILLEKGMGNVNLIKKLELGMSDTGNKKIANMFFIMLVLTFILTLIYVKQIFGSIWGSSWGGLLFAMHNTYSFELSLSYGFQFLAPIIVVTCGVITYYLFQKRFFLVGILAVMIIIESVILKEKSRILPLIIPIVIFVYIKNRKIQISSLLKYSILVIVGYFVIAFLAIMRDGTLGEFIGNFDIKMIAVKMQQSILNMEGETGLRNVFYKFVYYNNNFDGFNTGAEYLRLLLIWLPTGFSLGIKPPDFAVTMGSAELGVDQTAFSTHPTLYGECFANFYYAGIILAVFWAVFIYILEKIIAKRHSYLVMAGLSASVAQMYIIIARGAVYNAVYKFAISAIFLGIIYFLSRIKIKRPGGRY